MKNALLLILVFLGSQVLATCMALLAVNVPNLIAGAGLDETLLLDNPHVSLYTLLIVDFLVIGLLALTKVCRREAFVRRIRLSQREVVIGLCAFFLLVLGTSFFLALTPLPDSGSTALFSSVKGDWLCLLLLCVVGPLTEEVIFREGILRNLVQSNLHPMIAVLLSAAVFAIVHGNLAQIVPALVLGIALGIFYLRTGNLWFCTLAHVLNNTSAVILLHLPEGESWMQEMTTLPLLVCTIVTLFGGAFLLYKWWGMKTLPQTPKVEK